MSYRLPLRPCIVVAAVFVVLAALTSGPAGAVTCPETSAFAAISSANYSVSTGTVSADGTWSVSGGADSAHLEFFIDSTKFQIQTKSGTAGPWTFVDSYGQCGSHTFKVCNAPRFCSGGTCTVCLQQQSCATRGFSTTACTLSVSGPTCSWSCQGTQILGAQCTGSCSATVSGGRPTYHAHWTTDQEQHVQSSDTGTFSLSIINCTSGSLVFFDVTDANGGQGSGSTTCGFPQF